MADCGSNLPLNRARRDFLKAVAAAGAVAACPASGAEDLGPALSVAEVATLEALADTILPGSAQAGIAGFVTAMLARPDPLLAYRFLSPPDVPAAFYRSALAALDRLSMRRHARLFPALDMAQRRTVVGGLLSNAAEGWDGPPFGLVYFAVRNDAMDALYGQPGAYDDLSLPYMPHIAPPRPW